MYFGVKVGIGGLEWIIYSKVKSRQKVDTREAERETSKAGKRLEKIIGGPI